jgi:asparagine synthase (glutamine-hydrolysing)
VTVIAGYWAFDNPIDPTRACQRMLASQQVYAPGAPVCRTDGPLSLGRRLHAMLPEDRFERGPASTPSGTLLVADVRLDNRAELVTALGLSSGESGTLADAALLARALDNWGEGALDRLVGDFAFAWWDPRSCRLLLARDPIGQRPLHYHRGRGSFAFASMAKGLHALEEVPLTPNRQRATDFLALLPDTGSETFFASVERVRPAHLVVVTKDRVETRRYWNPSPARLRLARDEDYEDAMREQLDRAVAAQLRGAESAVGAHLSGGLDSAATASTAARLMAERGGQVTAYTAVPRTGFETSPSHDVIVDEGPLAAAVAARYSNVEHVKVPASHGSPFADLDRYASLYERPILNLCNSVWTHAILDDAKRRRLSVLLTGQHGNMSISYDGMPLLFELMRRGHLRQLGGLVLGLRRWGLRWGTIAAAALGPAIPVPLWRTIARARGKGTSLRDYTLLSRARADGAVLAQRARARGLDPSYRPRSDGHATRLWVLGRSDPGNYNKGMLGGWGVDVRDPTADRRLIEFCLSVPIEQYLAAGVPRSLARRAFADRLPSAVVSEGRKGYQAADWHEALATARGELAEEVERICGVPEIEQDIDMARMNALIADWPTDDWLNRRNVELYRLALLRGVSTGHFLRKMSGSNH